jgi:hypothetical protein
MNAARADGESLMEVLTPELLKLCRGAPAFGELSLRVILADGKVGRVCLGVEISRKLEPHKQEVFESSQATKGLSQGEASVFSATEKEED